MKKLIIASNNEHKIKEIKEILGEFPLEVQSLKENDIFIDVEENGKSFEENSFKKAKEIAEYLHKRGEKEFIIMADDSGLEVEYLNGAPGVYSARYAGDHGNNRKNNEKLLRELEGVPYEQRKASFVCFIVLITSNGDVIKAEGRVDGYITESLQGREGFGYDPLFYVPEYKKTFAEMSSLEKNAISHRGRALEILKRELNNLFK